LKTTNYSDFNYRRWWSSPFTCLGLD
jgi:hypothetical protein